MPKREEYSYTDRFGIERYVTQDDEEETEIFDDPGWDYVYDEYGWSVSCPDCGEPELRYHNGRCCCLRCETTFSDSEIEAYAGPWHHE